LKIRAKKQQQHILLAKGFSSGDQYFPFETKSFRQQNQSKLQAFFKKSQFENPHQQKNTRHILLAKGFSSGYQYFAFETKSFRQQNQSKLPSFFQKVSI
jgi:penicillin-binding protein-related factor A (putative recombinase)